MTKKTLEMLIEVLELRTTEAKKQLEQCENEIKNAVEEIIGIKNVKVVSVDKYSHQWVVEVSVVDDEEKRVFGAGFTLYYNIEEKRYINKGLEVNYGSCGAFNKNNKAQVDKVLAMAKVMNAFDELEAVFENLETDKMEAYNEARREYGRARVELEEEYAKEIECTLKVGDEYLGKYDLKVTITKITPKFVHYKNEQGGEHKECKVDFIKRQVDARMREE